MFAAAIRLSHCYIYIILVVMYLPSVCNTFRINVLLDLVIQFKKYKRPENLTTLTRTRIYMQ